MSEFKNLLIESAKIDDHSHAYVTDFQGRVMPKDIKLEELSKRASVFANSQPIIEKTAAPANGIPIYDPTPANVEAFVKRHVVGEFAAIPQQLGYNLKFIPDSFDPNDKRKVRDGHGTVTVRLDDQTHIDIPYTVSDAELIPFDTMVLGKEHALYSRENLKKVIDGIEKAKADGDLKSPLNSMVGVEKASNASTDTGFMGNVLRVQDQASRGHMTYASEQEIMDIMEKVASEGQEVKVADEDQDFLDLLEKIARETEDSFGPAIAPGKPVIPHTKNQPASSGTNIPPAVVGMADDAALALMKLAKSVVGKEKRADDEGNVDELESIAISLAEDLEKEASDFPLSDEQKAKLAKFKEGLEGTNLKTTDSRGFTGKVKPKEVVTDAKVVNPSKLVEFAKQNPKAMLGAGAAIIGTGAIAKYVHDHRQHEKTASDQTTIDSQGDRYDKPSEEKKAEFADALFGLSSNNQSLHDTVLILTGKERGAMAKVAEAYTSQLEKTASLTAKNPDDAPNPIMSAFKGAGVGGVMGAGWGVKKLGVGTPNIQELKATVKEVANLPQEEKIKAITDMGKSMLRTAGGHAKWSALIGAGIGTVVGGVMGIKHALRSKADAKIFQANVASGVKPAMVIINPEGVHEPYYHNIGEHREAMKDFGKMMGLMGVIRGNTGFSPGSALPDELLHKDFAKHIKETSKGKEPKGTIVLDLRHQDHAPMSIDKTASAEKSIKEIDDALSCPTARKVAHMMATSHEYKKPNIDGALAMVKNYKWELGTEKVSNLQGLDKPTNEAKVADIAERIKGKKASPLIVVDQLHGIRPQTRGKKIVLDGHHRKSALIKNGTEETPVYRGTYTGGAQLSKNELRSSDKAASDDAGLIEKEALLEKTALSTAPIFKHIAALKMTISKDAAIAQKIASANPEHVGQFYTKTFNVDKKIARLHGTNIVDHAKEVHRMNGARDMNNVRKAYNSGKIGDRLRSEASTIDQLLEKSATISEVTDYSGVEDLLMSKVASEYKADVSDSFTQDNNSLLISQVFAQLKNMPFVGLGNIPSGSYIKFPEKDGMTLSMTKARLYKNPKKLCDLWPNNDPNVNYPRTRSKLVNDNSSYVITQDGRYLPLVNERFFALVENGDWTSNMLVARALQPGNTYTAVIKGQVVTPFVVKEVRTGAEYGIMLESNALCEDIKGNKFSIAYRPDQKGVVDKGVYVTSMEGLMNAYRPQEATDKMSNYWAFLGESTGYPIIMLDKESMFIELSGLVNDYLQDPKNLMFTDDEDILKTAGANDRVSLSLTNRDKPYMFDMSINYQDHRSKTFEMKRSSFNHAPEGKVKGILRTIGFDFEKCEEIVNRAIADGSASLAITDDQMPWKATGGDFVRGEANSRTNRIKKTLFNKDQLMELAGNVFGQSLGGGLSGSGFANGLGNILAQKTAASASICQAFEKLAMDNKSAGFQKIAKYLAVKHNLDQAFSLTHKTNAYLRGVRETLAMTLEQLPELEKIASDLLVLKREQVIAHNVIVPLGHIQAALVVIDDLSKYASVAIPLAKDKKGEQQAIDGYQKTIDKYEKAGDKSAARKIKGIQSDERDHKRILSGMERMLTES